MTNLWIRFENVSFTYSRAAQPLIRDLSVHFARGWTGVVGANGVGKSTILKLATEILEPQEGHVRTPGLAIYCEQRTDTVPAHLGDLVEAVDGDACEIKDQLGVQNNWTQRWSTLSHGERKRAQAAVALWRKPAVLAMDEPTNHLDSEARDLLFEALLTFRGVGILVSHDRNFLDGLCSQCLFVEPPNAVLRAGNYSEGLQQIEKDEMTIRRQYSRAKHNLGELKREADRRREAASQADRKRSKRGLAPKDHDTRAKINLARVTGKDGVAGKRLSQLDGRLSQARHELESIKVRRTFTLGIWMQGSRSRRDTLFNIPAGSLSLGGDRRLNFPTLLMQPVDRIAVTGPNGCGKSTLVGHILQSLNLQPERVTYIPQEIDLRSSQEILKRVRALPGQKLGHLLIIFSRLGSRPQRLLETEEPSPGEIRKILLASGIANTPHLIVMDEPTNHLDLPSIECLDEALADCPCGLLLVSHDRRFLDAVTHQRWYITEDAAVKGRYTLKT
jgi:macrolide transport system ATP-binding/permease protein